MHTLQTTIELPFELEYDTHEGCEGTRDRFGASQEPDSPPEVELLSLRCPALKVRWTGRRDFDALAALLLGAAAGPCGQDAIVRKAAALIQSIQAAQMVPLLPPHALPRTELRRLQIEAARQAAEASCCC